MAHVYTETDRQHFAGYVEDRARLRPIECCGGLECWVEFGPPAMMRRKGNSGGSYCVGCGGAPEVPWRERYPGRPKRR